MVDLENPKYKIIFETEKTREIARLTGREEFEAMKNKKPKLSFINKTIIITLVFFICALIYSTYKDVTSFTQLLNY